LHKTFIHYFLKICSKHLNVKFAFVLVRFLSVSDFTAYQEVENIIS